MSGPPHWYNEVRRMADEPIAKVFLAFSGVLALTAILILRLEA
jgi:hypothetical protein